MAAAPQCEVLDTLTQMGVDYAPLMAAGCIGCAMGAFLTWNVLVPSNEVKTDRALLLKKLNESGAATKGFSESENIVDLGELDSRRKAYIVRGGCFDLAGHVVITGNDGFDLQKTIFHSMTGIAGKVVKDRIGITLFWTEHAQAVVAEAFAKIPRAPQHDRALGEFVTNDCNFGMEHADGHFMDHLKFCYEYSAAHFKKHSPRVLFLHSIMGVGTNYFPMAKEKIPKLQGFLTEFEYAQIEAFPSILRLLYHGPLIDELLAKVNADPKALDKLSKIAFHRVIDNTRVEMDAEAFWIQLNYQLMHLLDFLPFASWKANVDDVFLRNFSLLHELLTKAGQLRCNVDFDITEASASTAGQRLTLRLALLKLVTPKIMWQIGRKQIAKYSRAINHSLKYELAY